MTGQLVDQVKEPAQILITELSRILGNATLFASRDDTLRSINVVSLESTGTYLVATGTDRFYLGASAAPYADEKWKVLLPVVHVDTLVSILRLSARRSSAWKSAHLAISPEGMRFKVAIPADDLKFSFPTSKREDSSIHFPAWRELLKGQKVTPESPSEFFIDPVKLARFAKVKPVPYGSRHMRVCIPAANRPIRISIGDLFAGVLAPVRAGDGNDSGDDPIWL